MDFHTPETFMANPNNLMEWLEDNENLYSIPFLNHSSLQHLPDNSLVRFRGMIQDMLDPETYLERYELSVEGEAGTSRMQNGKYRDVISLQPDEVIAYDSERNVHGDRRTLFVISIPGLNDWAISKEKEMYNCEQLDESVQLLNISDKSNSIAKRSLETTDSRGNEDESAHVSSTKKIVPEKQSDTSPVDVLSREYLLNSPIESRPSVACMVKIYKDFDSFTLNTVIDVVGFLSIDPSLDGATYNQTEFDELEIQASNPPPSLIPRLHAIHIIQCKHLNPLSLNDDIFLESSIRKTRSDLLLSLTQCLFGDKLAAQYLLCHLLSTVYVRTDVNTLGQFSINLSNIPNEALPEYTTLLYSVMELLLPASHYLPMTLENLNNLQYAPRKDYVTNRLTSGILQLAPKTHLVVDETRLVPGIVDAKGVEAISHMAHLINHQKIKCDFQFYQIEYDMDVPLLVLSEGKSMLPSNFYVPLIPAHDSIKLIQETITACTYFLQKRLETIRTYLTVMKIKEFSSIDEEHLKMIQDDFVDMRSRDNNITSDDLHNLLVLSRLIGLSQGITSMETTCWNQAKSMENERRERIKQLKRNK